MSEFEQQRRTRLRRHILDRAPGSTEWAVRRQSPSGDVIEEFPSFDAAFAYADGYVYGLPGVDVVARVPPERAWRPVCGPGYSAINR